jgi:AbiV family abortive infection protein
MPEQLSKYKFRKIATESLINGLRLHFDSILLFKNKSYPTSLQISIIAIEEIAKAKWVEHYYYSSITNDGFPGKEFEQEWLMLLYFHPEKQYAFLARDLFEYSPKFVEFVQKGQLELQKQKATYVGLEKKERKADVNSRISIPNRVKESDAKRIISLLNDVLLEICENKIFQECYFGIEEMDNVFNESLLERLKKWKFKSGLKSRKWFEEWKKNEKQQVTNKD